MDKAIGLVTMLFVGFPMIAFVLLLGWVMDDDRVDKREPDDDSDTRVYIPSWFWKRGGLARHYRGGEETWQKDGQQKK